METIISLAAARAQGLKRYHGRPCKRGHGTMRLVSDGKCVACKADTNRQWRQTPEGRARKAEYNRTPEQRAKATERRRTPEALARDAEVKRQLRQDPAFLARHAARERQRRKNPEVRAQNKAREQTPKYRAKQAAYKQRPEVRAKINERERERMQNPEYRTRKAEQQRQRRQEDTNFRLAGNLRVRIRDALKNGWKSARTMELIGCSMEVLRDHLEAQFQPGMTWDNYGPVWHVDHCRPCASFDLTDPEQQRECFGFMNLAPMLGTDNIRKHAKPETETDFVGRTARLFTAVAA
jgi:hypothetical protein